MGLKVALVEDDPRWRANLEQLLRETQDLECVGSYATGEEAVKELPARHPQVVLMDINLPGISGVECLRQLRGLLPGLQVVMLTVYDDSDRIFNALQMGASGYLLKQTPRNELFAALRDVYAGGSPMTSNIARKVVGAFQKMGSHKSEAEELSAREREVLELLARGYLYKEIAESLHLSVPTVNTYIRRIYEKLHVRSRSQAVAKFTQIPGAAVSE